MWKPSFGSFLSVIAKTCGVSLLSLACGVSLLSWFFVLDVAVGGVEANSVFLGILMLACLVRVKRVRKFTTLVKSSTFSEPCR